MPSLEESLARNEITTVTTPAPTTPAAQPPASAAAPAQSPPGAAPPAALPKPELSRAEKSERVLDFASDLSVELVSMMVSTQGVTWNEKLEEYVKLSPLERRKLGKYAPAAFPYVELIESKLDAYPMIGLAMFALGFLGSISTKMKVIRAQVDQAKGNPPNPAAPPPGIPPAPAAAVPPPAAQPTANLSQLQVVPPRRDDPFKGAKI